MCTPKQALSISRQTILCSIVCFPLGLASSPFVDPDERDRACDAHGASCGLRENKPRQMKTNLQQYPHMVQGTSLLHRPWPGRWPARKSYFLKCAYPRESSFAILFIFGLRAGGPLVSWSGPCPRQGTAQPGHSAA